MEMKKYWPLPLVVAWVGDGSSIIFAAQIGEPSGTSSILMGPLFSFEPLPWDQMCQLLTLHFFYHLGEMAKLFFFNDVIKVVQANGPSNKRARRLLVKITSLSQDADNS